MEVILKVLVVLLLFVLYVLGMAIEAAIGLFGLVLPLAVPVLSFGLPVLLIALRLRFQKRINPG